MRTESAYHKIRIIQKGETVVYGVTIPPSFKKWIGAIVYIQESGNALILESGTVPTALNKKQIQQQSEVIEKIKL